MVEKGFDWGKCLHLEKYLSGVLAISTRVGLCFWSISIFTLEFMDIWHFSWEGFGDSED
jgi:hypothetical protein